MIAKRSCHLLQLDTTHTAGNRPTGPAEKSEGRVPAGVELDRLRPNTAPTRSPTAVPPHNSLRAVRTNKLRLALEPKHCRQPCHAHKHLGKPLFMKDNPANCNNNEISLQLAGTPEDVSMVYRLCTQTRVQSHAYSKGRYAGRLYPCAAPRRCMHRSCMIPRYMCTHSMTAPVALAGHTGHYTTWPDSQAVCQSVSWSIMGQQNTNQLGAWPTDQPQDLRQLNKPVSLQLNPPPNTHTTNYSLLTHTTQCPSCHLSPPKSHSAYNNTVLNGVCLHVHASGTTA